jgi:hypothetical protein
MREHSMRLRDPLWSADDCPRATRAAFPHVALTSGEWRRTAGLAFALRLAICAPAPVTRFPSSVPSTCFAGSHFSWFLPLGCLGRPPLSLFAPQAFVFLGGVAAYASRTPCRMRLLPVCTLSALDPNSPVATLMRSD